MDDDIAELRGLIKKNIALAEDTNRLLRKMRRSAMWGRFFQIVWWVAVVAVSGAAYYYYLQPYVDSIEHFYGQLGMSSEKQPGVGEELQKFMQSFSTQPK